MLEKLPEIFGTATDLYLKKKIDEYRRKTNSGEILRHVLTNGVRKDWEREWEKWVECVDEIEDGLICCTALNYCLIDDLLYENTMWYCMNKISDEDMKRRMLSSVFHINGIIGLIESLKARVDSKYALNKEHEDHIMLGCRKAAYDVITEVSEIRGFKDVDQKFCDECDVAKKVTELEIRYDWV